MTEGPRSATANERFKQGHANWTRAGLLVAVAVHVSAFSLIRFDIQELAAAEHHPFELVIPKEADLPAAPPEIMRPALPRLSHAMVTEPPDLRRWAHIPPAPIIPPPSVGQPTGPRFVPYDTPPFLENAEAIGRILQREYPRSLRQAGVEGRVELWLLVTERGNVERGLVKTSSGDVRLDEAALRVATEMRFSPARNREQVTAVWVKQWIVFVVR